MGLWRTDGGWRALIGALAVYAVVLQAFLAGLAPAIALPGGTSAICAPDGPHGDPSGDGSAPSGPSAHHACCLAACWPAALAAPAGEASLVVWPARPAVLVAWRRAEFRFATGPPPSPASARGPPSA